MSKTTNPTSDDKLTFEEAMAELDELVSRMEDGELSLDDSLKAFERGVMLTTVPRRFSAKPNCA